MSGVPKEAREAVKRAQEVLKELLEVSGIELSIIDDKQKRELAKYMNQLAEELREPAYKLDAQKVERAHAILLIGLRDGGEVAGMNCGACGFPSCEDMLKNRRAGLLLPGPTCIVGALNLGLATGLLTKTYFILNGDSKTMLRIGVAAKRLYLLRSDIVMGLPLTPDIIQQT